MSLVNRIHAERASKAVWAQPLLLYMHVFACCVHPGRSEGSPGETGDREGGLGGELYEEAGLCEIHICVYSFVGPLPSVSVHWWLCLCACAYMRAHAHVCVHVCVLKSRCSSPQEATLLAKERELRENLRLERDKVSGGGVGA